MGDFFPMKQRRTVLVVPSSAADDRGFSVGLSAEVIERSGDRRRGRRVGLG